MKRVAALYLPDWPIDRLRRAERTAAPPEPPPPAAELAPLARAAAAEQVNACSVPRGGGWRPGARWSREELATRIETLPAHRRPSQRQLGRCDEAAGNPFRPMQSDEVGKQIPAGRPARPYRAPPGRPPEPTRGALVTAIRQGSRQLVAAASPQARAIGLHPGMAITQARALSPGLAILPADPQGDLAALRRLALRAARRWSPGVAIEGADTLLIDLTGVAHLHGGEKPMASHILRFMARRGFTARIAIADTAGAAWALVRHAPDPLTRCPAGAHAEALAALPVSGLRVDDAAVELLRRLGIDTIGQLAAMPRAPLARRFGSLLVRRLEQALGTLPEPIIPVIPREPIAVHQRFAEPIATAEAIAHWIGALAPQLTALLEAAGLGARAVELVADRIDGVPQRLRFGLARASRDPLHLLRLLARRIDAIDPGYGIDAIALYVRRAEPLAAQPIGAATDDRQAADLAVLIDTLATRIGMAGMWRIRPVESDVPERSAARSALLDPPGHAVRRDRRDDVRQLDRSAACDPWHPQWPRPVRLLARPERLDHVLAELPDQPPRRFTWRGSAHRVVHADGPERITGEWWRHDAERHAVRDYFRVEDDAGRRYWLFRRGDGMRTVTGDLSWYIHGVFG